MAYALNQILKEFEKMQKVANETLSASPDALVGVDSLPGSEHDANVPSSAKKPDKEATQGLPAGSDSAAGAVSGGDAKILNETKLEIDQPLLNPEKKPLVSDDALSAKTASDNLKKIVEGLLDDIAKDSLGKQASATAAVSGDDAGKGKHKEASMKNKVELDSNVIAKLAASQAAFDAGRKAAEDAIKKCASDNSAAQIDPRKLIRDACIKEAQAQGLAPDEAAAAADNVMSAAGVGGGAQPEDVASMIPPDVTEEELGNAIVDLVQSGELDPESAKALVSEISGAGEEQAAASEDEVANIIAEGIESGEITPEDAQAIAAAIDGGAAPEDVAAEEQGAADAANAIQDAQDEAAGAAAAEEAIKQASAAASTPGKRILSKVAESLAQKQASADKTEEDKYIEGFCKKASEMGVEPKALAKYILAGQGK